MKIGIIISLAGMLFCIGLSMRELKRLQKRIYFLENENTTLVNRLLKLVSKLLKLREIAFKGKPNYAEKYPGIDGFLQFVEEFIRRGSDHWEYMKKIEKRRAIWRARYEEMQRKYAEIQEQYEAAQKYVSDSDRYYALSRWLLRRGLEIAKRKNERIRDLENSSRIVEIQKRIKLLETTLRDVSEESRIKNNLIEYRRGFDDGIIDIFLHIKAVERERGLQNLSAHEYLGILLEEVGELAQAINNHKWEDGNRNRIREEAVQVAQVAIDIIRALDRGIWS